MPYLLFLLIIQSPLHAEELLIDVEQLDAESMLENTGVPPIPEASLVPKESQISINEWQQPSLLPPAQKIPRTLSTTIDNLPSVRQFSSSLPKNSIQEIHITVQ